MEIQSGRLNYCHLHTRKKNTGRIWNKKTRIIPECIEIKKLNTERAQQLIKDLKLNGKKIIGTTSALVQHKDPQTLVKAIKILSQKRSDFVMLHFGDGLLKAEIETMLREQNLTQYYKLAGFAENVEDFFSIFNIFVMSSEEEGLGSSVLDAFIYKVPVVSTNAGGLAELVNNRGVLVNKKDPEALAVALDAVLNNPDNLSASILNAFKYADEELNIESVHKKYIQAFDSLIN